MKSPPRQLLKTYVPLALRKRLRQYAANKGVSASAVNHAALERYLDEGSHQPAVLRKLDRIERNQQRGQRDGEFLIEAFAVFVQIWLAHTPRLGDTDKAAAEQSALKRFREYAEHVADNVAEGGTFLGDLDRENVAESDIAAPEPTTKPRGAR